MIRDIKQLGKTLRKLSGSTDITVRHSISIDSSGDMNERFSIFDKRWVHAKSIDGVLKKWEQKKTLRASTDPAPAAPQQSYR